MTTDDFDPASVTTDDFDIKPPSKRKLPPAKVIAITDQTRFEAAKKPDFGDANEGYDISVSESPAFQPRPLQLVVPKGESPLVQKVQVKPVVTPRQAKRAKDESYSSLAARQQQLEDTRRSEWLQQRQAGAQAELRSLVHPLAQLVFPSTPAEYIPSPEVVLNAAARGAGDVIGSAVKGVSLLTGQDASQVYDPSALPQMNPEDASSWTTKIASGAASALPFAIISSVTGGVGAGLLGAASQAGQTYDEARAQGFSDSEAKAAATLGGLIGSLEGAMGIGKGEFAHPGWIGGLKHWFKEAGEEAVQEGLSQFLNNVNAKIASGYDPQRALLEGVGENALIGGIVGGIFNAPHLPGSIARSKAQASIEASQVFDPAQWKTVTNGPKPLAPSMSPFDIKLIEQRAADIGRPLALTPETKAKYETEAKELKLQLLNLDPTSPEFQKAADRYVQLSQAIIEAPEPGQITDDSSLKQHLINTNLGHEGAAEELMTQLRPQVSETALSFRPELYRVAYRSSERATRFYPRPNNPSLTGTVYMTPQTMEDLDIAPILEGGRDAVAAVNIPIQDAIARSIQAATRGDLVTAKVLSAAIQEAQSKGLNSLSIVSYSEGQGLVATRKLLRHESFHVGQNLVAGEGDPRSLTSDEVLTHPLVTKAAQSSGGQEVLSYYGGDLSSLAFEMAAYSAGGQYSSIGLTPAEGAQYLASYFFDIVSNHGLEGLDKLVNAARPSQSTLIAAEAAKAQYQEEQQQYDAYKSKASDFAASLRSPGSQIFGSSGERVDSSGQESERGSEPDRTKAPTTDALGFPPGGAATSEPSPGGPPIVEPILNEPYFKDLVERASQVMMDLGIELDPTIPVVYQLQQAVATGDAISPQLAATMAKHDLTPADLAHALVYTASKAGRDLNYISQAQKLWADQLRTLRLRLNEATTPEEKEQLQFKIDNLQDAVPAEKQLRDLFADLRASQLGQSLWRRSGNLIRKMALSAISTAANNLASTALRLMINTAVNFPKGVALGLLNPKKYGGSSYDSLVEAAWQSGLRELKPVGATLMALDPRQLKDLVRRRTPEQWREMQDTLAELHVTYPDQYRQLMGYAGGILSGPEVAHNLTLANKLLAQVTDPGEKANLAKQLKEFKKVDKFNQTLLGKLTTKTEGFYELFLTPLKAQELFVRYPYAVAGLKAEAEKAGLDLNDLIKRNAFSELPETVIQKVVDDTLDTTYAYNPKLDKGRIERGAAKIIEGINAMGPLGSVIELFPRALYNGLKFWYEFGPWGALAPGSKVASALREAHQSGESMREAVAEEHIDRFAKAAVGTMMLAVAYGLRNSSAGGDEWWQLKSRRKDKKGNPVYIDVRRWQPMAGYVWLADYLDRVAEGRAVDKSFKEWGEIVLGMKRTDSTGSGLEYIDAVAKYWGDPDAAIDNRKRSEAERTLGNAIALPLTPLLNIRDLIGQFSDLERRRKELKGKEILGPSLDRLPWLRESLPDAGTQTEPAPLYLSHDPMTRFLGIQFTSGGNFVTRELARLGINPARWLGRDPDPRIDAAQRAALATMVEQVSKSLSQNPWYQGLSDKARAAYLESMFLGGEGFEGWAALAKQQGLKANPTEAFRRELLRGAGHPLQRRATGVETRINELIEKMPK